MTIASATEMRRRRLFARMVSTFKPGGDLIVQDCTPKRLDYKTGGPGLLEHLYTGGMCGRRLPRARSSEVHVLLIEPSGVPISGDPATAAPADLTRVICSTDDARSRWKSIL